MNTDLLYPDPQAERRKHKLRRLVQGPNGTFVEVKCKDCQDITYVYSHANTPVMCSTCKNLLTIPAGGRCRFTDHVDRTRNEMKQ